MAELRLRTGDYVPDGMGGLERVEGREALLQRVLFKLTARRGQFPFWEDLGSRLWQLGRVPPGQRQGAAVQYAAEALADEPGLTVNTVTLTPESGSAGSLTVEMTWQGQDLAVTLDIR